MEKLVIEFTIPECHRNKVGAWNPSLEKLLEILFYHYDLNQLNAKVVNYEKVTHSDYYAYFPSGI